jgi:type 1 glutamine amidotransferase
VRPLLIVLGPAASAADLAESARAFDAAVRPAIRHYVDELARLTPISSPANVPADERQRVEAAVPRRAPANPSKPRKLLVLDLALNGAFYHGSTALGNLSLQLMSERTGAFTPVFSNDLQNLAYPAIKQFDGIFLNQIQGNVFDDDLAIEGLTRYVREGGGVVGLHAATWASPNVPAYGALMGATSGAHKYNGEPGAVRVDDPASPITAAFGGKGFEFLDEFYHYIPGGPFSRDALHVLLSLDPARRDLPANQYATRPDNDYGLVWIRRYGQGRVFTSGLGHRAEFYDSPAMQQMLLAGVQFVLGDLSADTTPSAQK